MIAHISTKRESHSSLEVRLIHSFHVTPVPSILDDGNVDREMKSDHDILS